MPDCKARLQGQEMYCPLCLKTWDMDDKSPCTLTTDRPRDSYGKQKGRANVMRVNNIEGDR